MDEPEPDFGCCVHSTDPDTGAVTLTCKPHVLPTPTPAST